LLVTTSRQAHHPFLRDLTATPSALGRHYVVVTMTADQAALDADEPFTLIIADYAQGFAPVIAAHRVTLVILSLECLIAGYRLLATAPGSVCARVQ
jgi:hypothetical protein